MVACQRQISPSMPDPLQTSDLKMEIQAADNREYSFTNKRSAYWYGKSHQGHFDDYFAGWNIATRRIFSDYQLYVDGQPLLRSKAKQVHITPDALKRNWDNATECLQLVDNEDIIFISLETKKARQIGISIDQRLLNGSSFDNSSVRFIPKESHGKVLEVAPLIPTALSFSDSTLTVNAEAGGFICVYGSPDECKRLINKARTEKTKLIAERTARMNRLLSDNVPLNSNLPELDHALAWLALTMDQLITNQQGKGIYAGLPWFNSYWGRDMFIALPGATMVTGQFEEAEEMLRDFAKLQNRDSLSPNYGRIPNWANPDTIMYNTADGTPRYVIEAEELLKYTGDRNFLQDIYPTIQLSINQCLKQQVDEKGYLLHEDADTWMDVKHEVPGSPRGNRANDIQWLWYRQLMAGAHLATLINDTVHATRWEQAAQHMARHFEQDFCDKENILVYDHLNNNGTPDLQYRPNQLFCFDLIDDNYFKHEVAKRVWRKLVYPWGVASLAQDDPQFHPYHHDDEHYFFDDAYHNGTVWLWVNGIAMQRMIEYGYKETAWQLFCNMNRQALKEGAVGSLSENADAYPRKGTSWAKRSGTFLQAWSNSEQLRVWYQCFLGIQPDLLNGIITVRPALPSAITELQTRVRIGKGWLYYKYSKGKVTVTLDGVEAKVQMLTDRMDVTDGKQMPIIPFCQPDTTIDFPCMHQHYKQAK